MKPLTAVAFVVLVALSATAREKPKKAVTPEALKGEWKIVSYNHLDADWKVDLAKSRATFADGNLTLKLSISGEEIEVVGTFIADEKTDPKALDVSFPGGGFISEFVAKAVWKVEKDTLTICFTVGGDDRPKDFKPTDNTGVLVLERVKK